MIYTVTFNPSLDHIIRVSNLKPGVVNRSEYQIIYPGGKGINVSIMLKNLGIDSVALGFTAGFTGREISLMLKEDGCQSDFITVDGLSRINTKIKSDRETEINGQGPNLSETDFNALLHKLDSVEKDDILVLAGSIPGTLPADSYERILKHLDGRGIHTVVDATTDLLRNVLKYRPFLIKPNNHELGDLFGETLEQDRDVVRCAEALRKEGARNVLVSMAGNGAILVSETGMVLKSEAPKGTLVNSVGSGDSMVAGFLAGYLESHDYTQAFRTGVAAGSASAFQEWLADRKDVDALISQMEPPRTPDC